MDKVQSKESNNLRSSRETSQELSALYLDSIARTPTVNVAAVTKLHAARPRKYSPHLQRGSKSPVQRC
jgi:hypothetical protein